MKSITLKYSLYFLSLFLFVFACKDLDKPTPTNKPVANFTIINTDFTASVDVTVLNTSTNTTANTTYEWDFGNGQTSTDKNPPVAKYILMKNYEIKLTVREGTESDTKTQIISVLDPKQPLKACFSFSSDNGNIAPSTISFDATCSQNATIYNWDFGDSGTGVGIKQNHLYTKAGLYNVKLKVINGAETKDTTIVVNILNAPPKICYTYTADNNATMPSKVTFDASCSQNATTYNWDFGDNQSNTATGAKPLHTYVTNNDYKVKLSVTGLGGTVDSTFIIKIKGPTVVSAFTVTNGNCVGPCTVTFTNTSQNATTYNWDFGDGKTSTSTASSVTNVYNAAGTYTVKLTATGPGGSNQTSQTVTIGTGNKAAIIDISTISITPLYGIQRSSDGKYHIVFKTTSSGGTLYSVLVDKEFKATTPITVLSNFDPYSIEPITDGSFLISAQQTADNKNARLVKVSSSQSLSFDKSIDFNDGIANTTSYAYGVSNLANEEFILSGVYVNSSKTPTAAPAINTFNKSGTSLLKKRVESTGVDNIYIARLAQTSSGNLIGLGNTFFCWSCTPKRLLVILTASGTFSKTIDLGTSIFNDIIRIGTTNNFLLVGSNKIRSIDANGLQLWEKTILTSKFDAINNATTLSDGSILLCGKKADNAYAAKYNSSGTLLWEKTFPVSIKTGTKVSYATTVESTADGGFLITGGSYTSGVNDHDLYLIKTDKDGNAQ